MKKLTLFFVLFSFITLQAQDTADVEYIFKISDEFNNSQELIIGKDPFGSDGLDPQFGEVVFPQVPSGQFGARLMFLQNLGITALKDIRFGCYWADTYTHLIWLRYDNNSSQMTIDWNWDTYKPNFLISIGFYEAISGKFLEYFTYDSDSSVFMIPKELEYLQMEVSYNGTLSGEEYELLTPNGGDTLHIGQTYNISWWSNQLLPYLNIEYSTDTGLTWNLIASNVPTSLNNYSWTVPNSLSNHCLMRVGNYPCRFDVSDNFFVITYALPVELISFSSSVVDNDVTLNWTTATETNNFGFEIQRLRGSKIETLVSWETIYFVNGNGTTTETKSYAYKDENLSASKYQYRLKQFDFDGTFKYSNIIEIEILPPVNFYLGQNYPNPFNPSTKISWQSQIGGRQVLKVFDVLGNEVITLADEYKPAGSYEVEFQSAIGNRQLASGVYYYQLRVGELIQTKKMILLR